MTEKPILAIYRQRDDGDYEFVLAHNCHELDMLAEMSRGKQDPESTEAFVNKLCKFLGESNGFNFKIAAFDEPNQMPSILSFDYFSDPPDTSNPSDSERRGDNAGNIVDVEDTEFFRADS